MKTNSLFFDCISTARKNYDLIAKIKVDNDYDFDYEPSMMQKFMYDGLKKNRIFCNWSGTGAGKTLSALFAGRKLNCRVMVIICPNDVKDAWEGAILGRMDKEKGWINGAYPTNSNVMNVSSAEDIKKFDRNVFNYIIFNYDKFSVESGNEIVTRLLELNIIDFLCFDELHFVKVRNTKDTPKRHECIKHLRMEAEKNNSNIYISGMTATPVINSLSEARSLVELITGKKYPEIGNRLTYNNLYQAYKALNNIGFRYVRNHGIEVKDKVITIDGQYVKDELAKCIFSRDKMVRVEKILTEVKMNDPEIIKNITKGTIIFSYYRDGRNTDSILKVITDKLNELGIGYAVYTGGDNKRGKNKDSFINGEVDVLVATKPISTGVDGLQKVSNKMIMIGYPWTGAEYDQLVGRIIRQGSNFKEVTIIHPQVNIIKNDGENWSYDHHRREVIRTKKELADVVLDGKFNVIYNIHKGKMVSDMLEDLKRGTATDYTPERGNCEYVEVEYTQKTRRTINQEAFREYNESILKDTHKMAESSNHETFHSKCIKDPDIMKQYHEARENAKQGWPVDPVDKIGKKINSLTFNKLNVADMGCGTCKLRTLLDKHNVICIDHTGVVPGVIQADMANLNGIIDNNSIDVAIYCLSLWGKNYQDYFKEAHRILKNFGIMYIVVPTGKYDKDELISTVCSYRFKNTDVEICNDSVHEFMYLEFSKR